MEVRRMIVCVRDQAGPCLRRFRRFLRRHHPGLHRPGGGPDPGLRTSFNKTYPDVKIKWVRDSTGIVTAKLLAEKAAPQADVVMGLAASSLLLLEKENMLLPYAPKGVEKLSKN